jgi:hypothetical protein
VRASSRGHRGTEANSDTTKCVPDRVPEVRSNDLGTIGRSEGFHGDPTREWAWAGWVENAVGNSASSVVGVRIEEVGCFFVVSGWRFGPGASRAHPFTSLCQVGVTGGGPSRSWRHPICSTARQELVSDGRSLRAARLTQLGPVHGNPSSRRRSSASAASRIAKRFSISSWSRRETSRSPSRR